MPLVRHRIVDPLTVARGAWGALLLARPHSVLDLVGGESTPALRRVTRALGARHLGEAIALAASGDRRPPRWTVLVDALHGTSMVVLGAVSARYRRDALLSAGGAGVLVALAELERRRTG